jgi:hypothetical protein
MASDKSEEFPNAFVPVSTNNSKTQPIFISDLELARILVAIEKSRDKVNPIGAVYQGIRSAFVTKAGSERVRFTDLLSVFELKKEPADVKELSEQLSRLFAAGVKLDDLLSTRDPILHLVPPVGNVVVDLGKWEANIFEPVPEHEQCCELVETTFDVQALDIFMRSINRSYHVFAPPIVTNTPGMFLLENREKIKSALLGLLDRFRSEWAKAAIYCSIGSPVSNIASLVISEAVLTGLVDIEHPYFQTFMPGESPQLGGGLFRVLNGNANSRIRIFDSNRADLTNTHCGIIAMRQLGHGNQLLVAISGVDMEGTIHTAEAFNTGLLSRAMLSGVSTPTCFVREAPGLIVAEAGENSAFAVDRMYTDKVGVQIVETPSRVKATAV